MRRSRNKRRGLASLEAVIATFVALPAAAALLLIAIRACRNLFQVCASLVGWPYL